MRQAERRLLSPATTFLKTKTSEDGSEQEEGPWLAYAFSRFRGADVQGGELARYGTTATGAHVEEEEAYEFRRAVCPA